MKFELKNCTKKYGDQLVLDDISISLDQVKALGIIGESGCGKSTLLRQLAGIESLDQGEIDINGLSPEKNKQVFQQQIGYVFQKHNLFPHLSIRKNLLLILEKIKKMDSSQANVKVDEVLASLKISDIAEKKPNQVSGGQAQRASIARALSTDSKLLFLDEPTAALDPILTEEVLKSVTTLKDKGIEFVFITHELEFLKDFADYVIFMEQGKIVEHGTIDIMKNPKTEKLGKFLRIK